jgi:uncharacterized RDD family membrane protein YckC
MILMWFVLLANVSTDADSADWANFAGNLVVTAALVFTLIDIGMMMVYRQGRSLHDLVSKTWVVLDTD